MSRVEGRGFHVEGEGTMSRVEGNIFFSKFFFGPKKPIGDHIPSVGPRVCRHTGRSNGFRSGDFWGTKLTSDPLKKWLPVRLDRRHSGVQINF